MAYRVIPKDRKKPPFFKLALEKIENGKRSQKDIPKSDWLSHGFSPSMSIEDARKMRDSLNAKAKLTRGDGKRQNIQERMQKDALIQVAHMPAPLLEEFEKRLFSRKQSTKKLPIYWATVKKILADVALEPKEWADNKGKFYDLFSEREYSMSYVRTLIPLLNAWGTFYSKKHGIFFEALPTPKGRERELIADANYDAEGGGNKESDPLTPQMLEKKRSTLKPEHYNWLYVSIWYGLRPIEIDGLKDSKNWKVETHTIDKKRIKVLSIYQSKLTSVAREKRWKLIPCFLQEQIEGLKLMEKCRRPLSKSMLGWFDGNVGLYGGRKGFVELMQSKGQQLEDISQWLGHTSIERTWKSYKDKKQVRFR